MHVERPGRTADVRPTSSAGSHAGDIESDDDREVIAQLLGDGVVEYLVGVQRRGERGGEQDMVGSVVPLLLRTQVARGAWDGLIEVDGRVDEPGVHERADRPAVCAAV